jgi:hypothetical protein
MTFSTYFIIAGIVLAFVALAAVFLDAEPHDWR